MSDLFLFYIKAKIDMLTEVYVRLINIKWSDGFHLPISSVGTLLVAIDLTAVRPEWLKMFKTGAK